MSTAVLVYELAGQTHLRLPLSIVVITAYFVGNRFSKTVYEVLIDANGTPFLPELPKRLGSIPVAQVMLPLQKEHVLALDSTYEDAWKLLRAIDAAGNQSSDERIPDRKRASQLPNRDQGSTSSLF